MKTIFGFIKGVSCVTTEMMCVCFFIVVCCLCLKSSVIQSALPVCKASLQLCCSVGGKKASVPQQHLKSKSSPLADTLNRCVSRFKDFKYLSKIFFGHWLLFIRMNHASTEKGSNSRNKSSLHITDNVESKHMCQTLFSFVLFLQCNIFPSTKLWNIQVLGHILIT